MTRRAVWLLAGTLAVSLVAQNLVSAQRRPAPQPERAGWMMGMYVGENKNSRYPFVVSLDQKSEARIKGIRPGDEIMRVDNREQSELEALFKQVGRMPAGRPVKFWIRRGALTLQFDLRVTRTPGGPFGEQDADRDAQKPKPEGPPVKVVHHDIPPGDE